MTDRSAESGFMMAELLVSMAIIALGLLFLFDLKKDLIARQVRQIEAMESAHLEANGLAMLRRVDPGQEPVGNRPIGQKTMLTWKSVQIGKTRRALQWRGRETMLSVAMFSVTYSIAKDGRHIAQGKVELVGRPSRR